MKSNFTLASCSGEEIEVDYIRCHQRHLKGPDPGLGHDLSELRLFRPASPEKLVVLALWVNERNKHLTHLLQRKGVSSACTLEWRGSGDRGGAVAINGIPYRDVALVKELLQEFCEESRIQYCSDSKLGLANVFLDDTFHHEEGVESLMTDGGHRHDGSRSSYFLSLESVDVSISNAGGLSEMHFLYPLDKAVDKIKRAVATPVWLISCTKSFQHRADFLPHSVLAVADGAISSASDPQRNHFLTDGFCISPSVQILGKEAAIVHIYEPRLAEQRLGVGNAFWMEVARKAGDSVPGRLMFLAPVDSQFVSVHTVFQQGLLDALVRHESGGRFEACFLFDDTKWFLLGKQSAYDYYADFTQARLRNELDLSTLGESSSSRNDTSGRGPNGVRVQISEALLPLKTLLTEGDFDAILLNHSPGNMSALKAVAGPHIDRKLRAGEVSPNLHCGRTTSGLRCQHVVVMCMNGLAGTVDFTELFMLQQAWSSIAVYLGELT